VVREGLAAEVGFAELVRLEHRAHRAVEHEDALAEQALELGAARVGSHGFLLTHPYRAPKALIMNFYSNISIN
jgi:hypothetical protein